MRTSRPAFGKYLCAVLGPGSRGQCLGQMFSRAFGASDFTGFWRHWNPFVGYFLAYFCFAPLRRLAPRPLCLLVTFALNGFLHDPVYVWPWGIARTERYRLTLAYLSVPMRVACHLLALVGPFAFSIGILLLTRI